MLKSKIAAYRANAWKSMTAPPPATTASTIAVWT